MVDLPRHVRARPNPTGRMYYSYERHRGRPHAWPPIPLPFGPQDDEFWRRCRQCESLSAERTAEGWSWSWLGRSGPPRPLPAPRGEGGVNAFWAAVDEAERLDRQEDGRERRTFAALIARYQAHPAYTDLAVSTRRDYDRHLAAISEDWGDFPVAQLTGVDAQEAIDARAGTPTVARYYRSVLSRLLSFGVPRGFAPTNVIRVTEAVDHRGTPHKPWIDRHFEDFFEHARPGLHLPVYSALYTGQRSIDVVPMARPPIGVNAIELVARKTGANVYVPIHFEYREILARTHIDHPRLHLSEEAEPWTLAGYRTAWQRDLSCVNARGNPTDVPSAKREAMRRLREAGVVFHGLRKNAVNMLLEAGNTEAEVSAIVEMSEQMVRHYAKDVNKRRLAINGMRKLEEAWKVTRANLFGPGSGTAH